MSLIVTSFVFALVLCVTYAVIFGGKTGCAGAITFVAATILTSLATKSDPSWGSTAYAVFLVDCGCMLALAVIAIASSRHWPIWALGFQIVAVATHIATIWAPEILPRAYQALLSFWSIPILIVMILGTRKDYLFEKLNVDVVENKQPS